MNEHPKPSLAEIAAALRDVVAEVDAARETCDGDFAVDSAAARDWKANEMPGEWGPQLLEDSYRTAELYGASVKDHMLALADAIENERPFAMASLARAVVEPAARSIWLLEPGIEPLERVRRLVNDILYAAYEHETLWADESRVPDNADIYAKIKKEATARGLPYSDPVRKANKFTPARLGVPRPSSQWLLGYATKSPQAAKFFYRAGSAVVHSALHGFDQRLAYSGQTRRRARTVGVDPDTVLRDCTFAVQAYISYLGALLYQTAWPDGGVLAAIDVLESVWQRIKSLEIDE